MDGFLDPSKLTTYRRNKMSDGKDLNGFTSPKVNDAPVWNGVQYAADPKPAFPATDKSSQDNAGLNNGGK